MMTELTADRHACDARILLTSVYWSEIEDLFEPDESPVDYVRVSVSGHRGFCYLTDRNLWWTSEQPGGGAIVRGRIPLAGIESLRWVDASQFAVTEARFETTYHSEFGTAAGQPRRRLTRFVWNLAAACDSPRPGSAGSGTPSPLPMAYRWPHVAHPPLPDNDPARWQTG